MNKWMSMFRRRALRHYSHLVVATANRSGESWTAQSALQAERRAVLMEQRVRTPDNPMLWGYKAWSQPDEDGIIERIYSALDHSKNKMFIENAVRDGTENSSYLLFLKGFRSVWVDCFDVHIRAIKKGILNLISSIQIKFDPVSITLDSIQDRLISRYKFLNTYNVLILYIDIYSSMNSIIDELLSAEFRPVCLVAEYNVKLPPSVDFVPDYKKEGWDRTDYAGTSLRGMCDTVADDYRIVAYSISRVNAFFVRKDVADQFTRYEVEDLYQPARYQFSGWLSGHRRSLGYLSEIE